MNNLGPIRVILLATDLSSKSRTALDYAVALADACQARLILAHALDPSSQTELTGSSSSELRNLARAAEAELTALSHSTVEPHGIPAQTIVRYGNPRDVIFQLQHELSADLVILGSGGKSGGPHSHLGSVAEALIRSLSCRVFTVGPLAHQPSLPLRHRSILLPTDFSIHSLAAVPVARILMQQLPAKVILFHVCRNCQKSLAAGQEELCSHRLTELSQSLTSHSITAESFLHISLQDNIAVQISTFAAKQNVDLILMGVRSGNLASGERLHGTVTEVIREAHCPVLTIAESAHAS